MLENVRDNKIWQKYLLKFEEVERRSNMKLSFTIKGIPKVQQGIHYTKNNTPYKPATETENEKSLRAGIINGLPFGFTPVRGSVKINKLNFIFPLPAGSPHKIFNEAGEARKEKTTKPHFIDCLQSVFKAMTGTVFYSEAQICVLSEAGKYYGSDPQIEIELETIDFSP